MTDISNSHSHLSFSALMAQASEMMGKFEQLEASQAETSLTASNGQMTEANKFQKTVSAAVENNKIIAGVTAGLTVCTAIASIAGTSSVADSNKFQIYGSTFTEGASFVGNLGAAACSSAEAGYTVKLGENQKDQVNEESASSTMGSESSDLIDSCGSEQQSVNSIQRSISQYISNETQAKKY